MLLLWIKLIFAACAGTLGMILNLTHREDGTPIQRLAIAYKVSIGVPATGDKNFPSKSDHFHIRAKNKDGNWVDDPAFSTQLQVANMPEVEVDGKKVRLPLREFDIIFLSDNIEEVFKTELAWWSASEKKCSGNGEIAMRSISALPPAEAAKHKDERYIQWSPCGDACPDLDQGRCKPNGQLFFIFKDRPVMGSVATFATTSYESVVRIHSSLLQIQSITGGRLRGIPLKIVMRPGKTHYTDPGGKKKTGSAFFVNIEFRQADFSQLVPKLLEHSTQYAAQIGASRQLSEHNEEDAPPIDIESETVQAQAMTSEFYPQNRTETTVGPENIRPASDDERDLAAICGRLGLNQAHQQMLGQALKGDIAAMRQWIGEFADGVAGLKLDTSQVHEFYGRAILQPRQLTALILNYDKPAATTRKRAPKKPETVTPEAPKQPEVPPQAAPPPSHPHPQEPEPAKAEEPSTGGGVWNF